MTITVINNEECTHKQYKNVKYMKEIDDSNVEFYDNDGELIIKVDVENDIITM